MATIVPIQDNSWMTTYWTPSSGSVCWAMIDDGVFPDNDTTYIASAITIANTGSVGQEPGVKFAPITYANTPSGFNLTFSARNESLGSLNILWTLSQGDPAGAHTDLTSGSILVSSTSYGLPKLVQLSPDAMAQVSNWADLWLKPYAQGAGNTMRITNVYITVPDPTVTSPRRMTLPILGVG